VTQSLEIIGGGHDPVGVSSQPIKFSSTASDRTCAGSKVPLAFISSKKDTRALEKNIVNIFFQRAEHGLNLEKNLKFNLAKFFCEVTPKNLEKKT
jgi:hypothetical protein